MANFGYSSATYVFQVRTANGPIGYVVAGSMGEAVDAYNANQKPAYLDQEFPDVSVRIVAPTVSLTSTAQAGASSGVTATAQAWATTYASIAAVGASGTNSSAGAQIVMIRTS